MVPEDRSRERAFVYFSRLVRRSHAVVGDAFAALLEDAVDRYIFSEQEADDMAWADVIVRGLRRNDGAEVYLMVEVFWGVGPSDVEQAVRRAALLTQTGIQAMPVMAGGSIVSEAAKLP